MFINIGFGNLVYADHILVILKPESSPIKRIVNNAKNNSTLIDATCGRKTKSVIILDNGSVLLSSVQPDTLSKRGKEIFRTIHSPEP